jgi:hypothetical protein
MTDQSPKRAAIAEAPFRRGHGPQHVGKVLDPQTSSASAPRAGLVMTTLKLPRTTTARGVRRAHARLID